MATKISGGTAKAPKTSPRPPVKPPVQWTPPLDPIIKTNATGEELYQIQVNVYTNQVKKLQDAMKAKNLTASQKNELQKRITNFTSKLSTAQTNLYTARGQFEKLLTGDTKDAFMALKALFTDYGLATLAPKIFEYVQKGYSSDTVSLLLQDTAEYKKRFAANDKRRAAGMPVLSPSEYLSVESSYRQIMRQSGLPIGFYDSPEDFVGWLGGDVSPSELKDRVDLATQATVLANPEYKKALNQMGLSDSEITAYFLDEKRALPLIQKTAATAAIGGEALRQGMQFDKTYAESLATQGVTREQAATGYSQLGQEYGTMMGLAGIYGGTWSQRMGEQALFEGKSGATEQKRRLVSSEKGQFGGSAGGARGGLAQTGGAR